MKIFSYAKDYKNKTYISVVLSTISVFVGIIPYYLVYKIIMAFVGDTHVTINYILMISGFILISLLLKSLLFFMAMAASHDAAYDTLMGMRKKLADKMIKMPMGEINKKSSGNFKNIFVDLIEEMELILAHMIPEGISNLVVPLVVLVYLFILDWRMALLSLGTIPLGMVMYKLMLRGAGEKIKQYFKASNEMNSNIIEYIGGMEVIKIFNQTTTSFEKYTNSVKNYKKFTLDWYKQSWIYMTGFFTIVPCTMLFVAPFGALFYTKGTLSLGTYVLCMLLSIGLGAPLTRLAEFVEFTHMLTEKSKIIEDLFDSKEIVEKDMYKIPENYDISFNNVTFAYDKQDVLKGVSFKAKENTVTALVGESGSGKSTLAKILVRFWDVEKGGIRIGDVNIKDIPFEKLMDYISYVSQDIYLFNTSIMENIRMGKPNATDEEVIQVAKLAQCHDFIIEFGDKYHTSVGDTGNKLSGGQKQRISIARALLKDAPIIILDEATAFTDPENEDKIQEALNSLTGGKTIIVIAHRLSTITDANNIIVMDKGKISAQGTHDKLLKKSKIYSSMWEAHTKAMDWDIKVKENKIS
ncbi:ATP-binding cassette, subfamily B [Maledivibacter halophilus]|uniref:ATP-binding cassette, subfamily B n=2 Tax=Maledivibacter halophilus TaxID=36842 RepID=A0A1T5LYU2_9FIRM|nr:ATP-binding cassette, subfamily B [Maledivibacter halophilus]